MRGAPFFRMWIAFAALALATPAFAAADQADHVPPGRPPVPPPSAPASKPRATPLGAAAASDTSVRVFVSLISGRDESGRDLSPMSMNITNYGFIGNNFAGRTPSMEYPVGTGHEHLVRGGLWVGALAADQNGAFTGVTIGTKDGTVSQLATSATEFSPEGDHIDVRSSLPNNRRY